VGAGDKGAATVGSDVTWTGADSLTLNLPASFGSFTTSANAACGGMIISVDGVSPYGTAAWGYVDTVTGNGATALQFHVTWVFGPKPTSGSIYCNPYRRVDYAAANVLSAAGTGGAFGGWNSPNFSFQN